MSDHPWDRSAIVMTTPCARASAPPSNASCANAGSSAPKPRRVSPALNSSKAGTSPPAAIGLWGVSHLSTTKGPPLKGWYHRTHNRPRNRGTSNSICLLRERTGQPQIEDFSGEQVTVYVLQELSNLGRLRGICKTVRCDRQFAHRHHDEKFHHSSD